MTPAAFLLTNKSRPRIKLLKWDIVLEKNVRELDGESCISLEEAPPQKQQIVYSRSFGERVTTYEALRQAVCQYAEAGLNYLLHDCAESAHLDSAKRTELRG